MIVILPTDTNWPNNATNGVANDFSEFCRESWMVMSLLDQIRLPAAGNLKFVATLHGL